MWIEFLKKDSRKIKAHLSIIQKEHVSFRSALGVRRPKN